MLISAPRMWHALTLLSLSKGPSGLSARETDAFILLQSTISTFKEIINIVLKVYFRF